MNDATSSFAYDSASSRAHPPQAGAALKSRRIGFLLFFASASEPSTSLLHCTAMGEPPVRAGANRVRWPYTHRMKRAFAAALLVLFALPLFGAEEKAERQRLVAELLQLLDAPSFHRLVTRSMLQRAAGSDADRAEAREYLDKVVGRVDFAKIVQEVDAPLVEKSFTSDELRDVIAFLKTKSGRKLMQIIPEMTAGAFVETSMALSHAAQQVEEESRREEKTKFPEKRTWTDIRMIATACEAYATDENHYPKASTMEELRKIVEPTYIRTLPLRDAWDHQYVYRVSADGQHYRIVSGGADGRIDPSSEMIVDIPDHAPIRANSSLDEDIIYQDGQLVQGPPSIVKDVQ
jgi:hypothetical protein